MSRFNKMIKSRLILILLALTTALTFVGYSTYIFSSTTNGSINKNDTVVAYVRGPRPEKACYDMETAFSYAENGDVIEVVPGTNPVVVGRWTIKGGVKVLDPLYTTIKQGVTLNIPYSFQGDSHIGILNTPKANSKGTANPSGGFVTNKPAMLKNNLTIAKNVQIINKGNIEIGGQLSGINGTGSGCGPTSGYYTKITMKSNSSIISGDNDNKSSIKCFGYIIEDKIDNGSYVDICNGDIYLPFIVRDFRGGNVSASMNQANTDNNTQMSPFNQYEIRNIEPLMILRYGSKLKAYCNIYAGGQDNYTLGEIIGQSPKSLLEVEKGTIFTSKYYKNDYIDSKTGEKYYAEQCRLDIYGGATMNALSLDLTLLIINVHISTGAVFFPLTWRHPIYLHALKNQQNAFYHVPNKLKLLPGSKIYIDERTTLKTAELTVLKRATDTSTLDRDGFDDIAVAKTMAGAKYIDNNYPLSVVPAEMIVKGTLEAGTIGGEISAKPGGLFSLVNGSIKTYEGYEPKEPVIKIIFKPTTPYSITNTAKGPQSLNASATPFDLTLNKSYLGVSEEYWIPNNITFDINYFEALENIDSSTSVLNKIQDQTYATTSNTNIDLKLNKRVNTGNREFVHWYYDKEFNSPIRDDIMRGTNAYRWLNFNEQTGHYELNLYARMTQKKKVNISYIDNPIQAVNVKPTIVQDAYEGLEYSTPETSELSWPVKVKKNNNNEESIKSDLYFNSWKVLDSAGNVVPGFEEVGRKFIIPSGYSELKIMPNLDAVTMYKLLIYGKRKINKQATVYLNGEDISEAVRTSSNTDLWVAANSQIRIDMDVKEDFPRGNIFIDICDMFGNAIYNTQGKAVWSINGKNGVSSTTLIIGEYGIKMKFRQP